MKRLVVTTIIIIAFILGSCDPTATFDKPQPDNVMSLASFAERLQGKYLAADRASILTITDKLITRHFDFDVKEHKDSLASFYKVTGDILINVTDGTKEKITLIGDTVIQHINWVDTIFNISTDNVLKKFKGYYFLNNHYSANDAWEVKKFSLKKGVLIIGSICGKDDIQKLKEITETTADTTSTNFNLTRRQFKKFVRQGTFANQEIFNRMVENSR